MLKKLYVVLGNHDYRGNVEAQLNPILRSVDKRWTCMRSFVLKTGNLLSNNFQILLMGTSEGYLYMSSWVLL